MIHRLIYEHELPPEGGLVLSDFQAHLSGSLIRFKAGDLIPKDKLDRLINVEKMPIRDLSKNPPRKNVIVDIDTGEETSHAKELRKQRDVKEPDAKEPGDGE